VCFCCDFCRSCSFVSPQFGLWDWELLPSAFGVGQISPTSNPALVVFVGGSLYSWGWEAWFTALLLQSTAINVHSNLGLCPSRRSYAHHRHVQLPRCRYCRQCVELVVADWTTSPRCGRRVVCVPCDAQTDHVVLNRLLLSKKNCDEK